MGLNALDFAVIAVYLAAVTLFGLRFRAKERTRKRRDVNQHEPRIMPRQSRPEHDAHENSRERQPAVSGGLG